jgi:lysophospholipase L1-like esterase
MIKRVTFAVLIMVAALFLSAVAFVAWQDTRKPDTSGAYVAMGSSFAAGAGLWPLEPRSPLVCMRTINGYPHVLARKIGLRLVDMSCGGTTTDQILYGGWMLLGPQLAAVGPRTRLVTVTSGGNDVGYIRDLGLASMGLRWGGPRSAEQRNFAKLGRNLEAIVREVRRRAPGATVALVSYPAVLPSAGTCAALHIDGAVADVMRAVAARLRETTRVAAARTGAVFVDMGGGAHDACSYTPWINGASPKHGAAFHPNQAGANATAQAVFDAISARDPIH